MKGMKGTKSIPENSSEYEHYEEDLNNYRSRSKSKLEEWNLIQSQYFTAEKQTRLEQLSPKVGSYSNKIEKEFEKGQNSQKSNEQLKRQLTAMRKMLQELNDLVNRKLNKYQLVELSPKGSKSINQPQKQSELLKATIAINHKAIEGLEKQIEQLRKKDKELEERDYLIELEERANQVLRFISQKKKEAHDEGVIVGKLDSKLIQMREAALQNQFKQIKILKHQILYFFKKFHENKAHLEELDRRYEQLNKKDQELTHKYAQYAKVAAEKNMSVRANPQYLQNKRIQEELQEELNKNKKKIEVVQYSNEVLQEKMLRQMDKMRRQIQTMEIKTSEAEKTSQEVSKITDWLIEKNQIGNSMIKSISYRFAETLLKDNSRKTPTIRPDSDRKVQMSQPYFKPKLKLRTKGDGGDKSVQVSARYQTIEPKLNKSIDSNDKNHQTLDFEDSKAIHNKFRIKPNLKRRGKAIETSEVGGGTQNEHSIHKPKRFNKGSGSNKKIPTGPLSDEYMRKLQEKGRKNLQAL